MYILLFLEFISIAIFMSLMLNVTIKVWLYYILNYIVKQKTQYNTILVMFITSVIKNHHIRTLSLYNFSRHRPEKNYYKILKVPYDASIEQIRDNYLKLVKKYHPDINPENREYIKKINEAYKVLSDQQLR